METVCSDQEASAWVRRFSPLIRAGGNVLDLACGRGRHARLLAAMGYQVEAVDREPENVRELAADTAIQVRCHDLEAGPWPYYGRAFDGIVVTNYLHRPLLPSLLAALAEGGVLIYETFMVGNERLGRPGNPAHLLRRGELLDVVRQRLTVVAFEQGETADPRPCVVQRLCACRRLEVFLP